MKLVLNWKCDGCGKVKPQSIIYDWKVGLGDVWHPRWLCGYQKRLLCQECFAKVFAKGPSGETWVA